MMQKRWWSDTLFKRLFVLMWVGLVASHYAAFTLVHTLHPLAEHGAHPPPGMPVMPSLPPGGLLRGTGERVRPLEDSGPPPLSDRVDRRPRGPNGRPIGGLPVQALWLDYLVRVGVIGAAAWFGARWLSAPMRKLAGASAALGRAIARHEPPPKLDQDRGTLEVRQAAQVFNAMAEQLHRQFDAQALLMAALSHDLRTPLARMRLRLEQLEQEPAALRSIDDLREMDVLIDSVLGMVRDQHVGEAAVQVDVHALLQSLADDLTEQGCAVSVEPLTPADAAERPPIVRAHVGALGRLFENLVGNAVRYGHAARMTVCPAGDELHVSVDDQGPGLAPDQLELVFRPFYRAPGSQAPAAPERGAGLGLYIARDIATRLGGSVTLCNKPEGGLRASVVLPLGEPA